MTSTASSTKQSQSWMKVPMRNFRKYSVNFQLFFPEMNGTSENAIWCNIEYKINPRSTLVKSPTQRILVHFKSDLQEKLDKFLEHEFFPQRHIPYSAHIMLVPKKNGKLKLVSWQLNEQTIKFRWPIPSIGEIYDAFKSSCYFSTINMWGEFINSPWKKQVRTIQPLVHH